MSDTNENTTENVDFDPDAWIDSLPEEQRPFAERFREHHVTAVQQALANERKERKALAAQVKELSAKATGNTDVEKQLQELSSKADASTQRADFYEEAAKRGVVPSRFSAAFRVAQVEGLINDKGRVDWEGLKEGYGEFFATEQKPKGGSGAGAGVGDKPKPKQDMNALIRGRGSR